MSPNLKATYDFRIFHSSTCISASSMDWLIPMQDRAVPDPTTPKNFDLVFFEMKAFVFLIFADNFFSLSQLNSK